MKGIGFLAASGGLDSALSSIVSNITSGIGSLQSNLLTIIGALIALGVISVGARWLWRKAKQWMSTT